MQIRVLSLSRDPVILGKTL